jgi:hypothetical protein
LAASAGGSSSWRGTGAVRGIGGRKDIWNRDCWFEMQEVAVNARTPNEKEYKVFVRLSIENLELQKLKHLQSWNGHRPSLGPLQTTTGLLRAATLPGQVLT